MTHQKNTTLARESLRVYSTEQLENILEKHEEWLKDKTKGAQADLSNADLSGLNLYDIDLRGAKLSYSDLSNTNLINSDLSYANLNNANLTNANLAKSYIHTSDLMYADLRYANLTNTDLTDSSLEYAYLDNADLTNANLLHSNLTRASLFNVKLEGAKLNYSITTGVTGLKIISINNIDYYNGDIQFIPSLNTVFYGVWQGDPEHFLKENLELSKGDKLATKSIKLAYELFKNYLEECSK